MREFNKLHSATTGEFLNTWISTDENFLIQEEISEGYGLIPNKNDMSIGVYGDYYSIPIDNRRNTTLRQCLETYYKIKNEL